MPERSKHPEAQCANCKRQIDVNRYIVREPEERSLGSIHLVKVAEDFAGAVRCPACHHVTIYARH